MQVETKNKVILHLIHTHQEARATAKDWQKYDDIKSSYSESNLAVKACQSFLCPKNFQVGILHSSLCLPNHQDANLSLCFLLKSPLEGRQKMPHSLVEGVRIPALPSIKIVFHNPTLDPFLPSLPVKGYKEPQPSSSSLPRSPLKILPHGLTPLENPMPADSVIQSDHFVNYCKSLCKSTWTSRLLSDKKESRFILPEVG